MIETFEKNLQNLINELKEKLKNIRGYRISLNWLQEIEVEAYGKKLPLKSLLHVVQLDPLSFRLEPWDETIITDVERSLRTSNVNLQVYKDGKNLIVKFPPLTEELKKEILKSLHAFKEDIRIKSRRLRDDFLKEAKNKKEKGEITEDEFYKLKEKVDKKIEEFNNEIEKILINKEKEIL